MALFGSGGHGFSLKALLEDPNLQNPPQLNSGLVDTKKGQHGSFVSNSNAAFLGGNLWERPSAGSGGNSPGDFDLEYMDLDEFLSENGIPINTEDTDDTQTISLLANALTSSPPQSPNSRAITIGPPSPTTSGRRNQGQLSPLLNTPIKSEVAGSSGRSNRGLDVYLPESPIRQTVSPLSFQSNSSNPASPSAIERCLLDDSFGVKVTVKAPAEKRRAKWDSVADELLPDVNFKVKEDDLALVTIPVLRQDSSDDDDDDDLDEILYSPDHWRSQNKKRPNHHEHDPDHLIQNVIPGQQNFDPKRRKFTEEELKPQPIIKKSKKVFVDEGSKDDRYWARRKKNNVAAKRSRDARRVKENQIAMRAAFLEQENDVMKQTVAKVRRENEDLRKRLAKYESV